MKRAFWGGCLNLDIAGGLFSMESVLYIGPPGGGIDIMFNLLPNEALNGELEFCWADLTGGFSAMPASCGGLSTIFLLDAAFLTWRRGECDLDDLDL